MSNFGDGFGHMMIVYVWFIKGEAEERGLHPWNGHKVGNELLTCLFDMFVQHSCDGFCGLE